MDDRVMSGTISQVGWALPTMILPFSFLWLCPSVGDLDASHQHHINDLKGSILRACLKSRVPLAACCQCVAWGDENTGGQACLCVARRQAASGTYWNPTAGFLQFFRHALRPLNRFS